MVAAEEFGGGHRLLARDLKNQEAEGTLAGGDDQAVGLGFEDRAGSPAVEALDGLGAVNDQPEPPLGGRIPGRPGRRGQRPRLHGADEVVDGRGRQRPVDQAVFLAELGGPCDLRPILGDDPGCALDQLGDRRGDQGAASAARRSSSSPAVSSGPIGVRARASMPPASIRGVIRMTVTPVSVSPFWIARATGDAPVSGQDRAVEVDPAQARDRKQVG